MKKIYHILNVGLMKRKHVCERISKVVKQFLSVCTIILYIHTHIRIRIDITFFPPASIICQLKLVRRANKNRGTGKTEKNSLLYIIYRCSLFALRPAVKDLFTPV